MTPAKDWNDPATWADQYVVAEIVAGRQTGNRVGYTRNSSLYGAAIRVAGGIDRFLRTQRQWSLSHRILMVGCGFGWVMEGLEDLGYSEVFGTDPSLFIQDRFMNGETRLSTRPKLRSEDVADSNSRATLKSGTGGGAFDVVITEQVITSLDDTELVSFAVACDDLVKPGTGLVIHFDTPDGFDPDYFYRSVEEAETLLGNKQTVLTVQSLY